MVSIMKAGTPVKGSIWKKVRTLKSPLGRRLWNPSLKEPVLELIEEDGTIYVMEGVESGVYEYDGPSGKRNIHLNPAKMVSWEREPEPLSTDNSQRNRWIKGWIIDLKSGFCPPFDPYYDGVAIKQVERLVRANQALKFKELDSGIFDKVKPFIVVAFLLILLVAFVLPIFGINLLGQGETTKTVQALNQSINGTVDAISNIRP